MTLPYISKFKVIKTGPYFHTYQYKQPVGYDLESDRKEKGKNVGVTKNNPTKIHLSSLYRSRTNVIHLVDSNAWMYTNTDKKPIDPVFITYTFREHITDVTKGNRMFTAYIKRLNYFFFKKKTLEIKYVAVIEFQKSGRVHYHAIFFNLPKSINAKEERKTREHANIWDHGYIDVVNVRDIRSFGRYIGKYMTKDHTDLRLLGKKRYFCSRGLIRPMVVTRERHAKKLLVALMETCEREPEYEKIFSTQYRGDIRYRAFKLNDQQLEDLINMYNVNYEVLSLLSQVNRRVGRKTIKLSGVTGTSNATNRKA